MWMRFMVCTNFDDRAALLAHTVAELIACSFGLCANLLIDCRAQLVCCPCRLLELLSKLQILSHSSKLCIIAIFLMLANLTFACHTPGLFRIILGHDFGNELRKRNFARACGSALQHRYRHLVSFGKTAS